MRNLEQVQNVLNAYGCPQCEKGMV